MHKSYGFFFAFLLLSTVAPTTVALPSPSTPLKHLVFIVQENHAFDNLFGAFPGLAAGYSIPLSECMKSSTYQMANFGYASCIKPFSANTMADVTQAHGLGHNFNQATKAYNNGAMNDFLKAQGNKPWANLTMAYFTNKTLPDYWDYASYFALDANFFSSSMSYSWPNHLFMVAPTVPSQCAMTCTQMYNLTLPNIIQAMNATGIDWRYYAGGWADGNQCVSITSKPRTLNLWNVPPDWPSIQTGQSTCHRIQNLKDLNSQLNSDSLPQVSWVVPMTNESDHPGGCPTNSLTCSRPKAPLDAGQIYVANIVNKIASHPDLWGS